MYLNNICEQHYFFVEQTSLKVHHCHIYKAIVEPHVNLHMRLDLPTHVKLAQSLTCIERHTPVLACTASDMKGPPKFYIFTCRIVLVIVHVSIHTHKNSYIRAERPKVAGI